MPKAYWRLQNEKASRDGGLTLPRFPLPSSAPEAGVISLILQIRKGGAQNATFAQGHPDGEQQGTNWNSDGSEPHLWLFFFKTCLPPRYLGDILSLIVYFGVILGLQKSGCDSRVLV